MTKVEKPKLSKQKKQLYVLGGLVGVLLLAVLYNVFAPSSAPKAPPRAPATADGSKPAGSAPAATGGGPQVASTNVYGPIEVLPIDYVTGGGDVSPIRNVFDYPPPPLPIPPKKDPIKSPPPPTINLGSVSPGQAIAGTSKAIPVTLAGSLFPSDVQVLVGGQVVSSQRVSSSQIRASLPASALATPGALKIEVKSASQPERLWSYPVSFNLTPSPEPGETFTYSGRVGAQAVLTFKDATKRPKLVSVGETVVGSVPWKVLAINDRQVDLFDTRNEIKKSLGLVAKSH